MGDWTQTRSLFYARCIGANLTSTNSTDNTEVAAQNRAKLARIQQKANAIFTRLSARNPSPKTELNYSNAFTLLVAVVLSAQATDRGVNRATEQLFALADHPAAMVALGEARIRDLINTIGLYKAKAGYVFRLSEILAQGYGGEVPNSRAALESLPGVGRKTANVVLNVIFGQPTLAVDTHIFRLSHRLGLAVGKNPEAVEQELLAIVPAQWMQHAHHWLILHGRYICTARNPKCDSCPISDLCDAYSPKIPK